MGIGKYVVIGIAGYIIIQISSEAFVNKAFENHSQSTSSRYGTDKSDQQIMRSSINQIKKTFPKMLPGGFLEITNAYLSGNEITYTARYLNHSKQDLKGQVSLSRARGIQITEGCRDSDTRWALDKGFSYRRKYYDMYNSHLFDVVVNLSDCTSATAPSISTAYIPPVSQAPRAEIQWSSQPIQKKSTLAKMDRSIITLQRKLGDLGYYNGGHNGRLDHQTIAAIERFQKDRRIPISGKADFNTKRALRLN